MTFDAEATAILHEGRQAHVATATKKAPTVTPVLYTPREDGIAFLTAASTRKAERLRKGQPVAVVVRRGGRAVTFTGSAEVLDPMSLDAARRLPELARTVGGFALRNSADLFGFARDAASGRLPLRSLNRRIAVIVRAGDVTVVDVPAGGEDAVVAWSADDGSPRAAAASWYADGERAAIAALPDLPDRARASVVTDDYGRPGPAAKSGVMLLGEGRFECDGDVVWVEIDPKKVATWAGTETETGTVR